MGTGFLRNSFKKVIFSLCAACTMCFSLYAEDWVLAARKFSYTQKSDVTSAQDGFASLLPSLMLEQISSSTVRIPTMREMADRQKNDLLTARIALFLQLSKEVQVRDSLVLQEKNPKKLKKLIDAENLKIEEIQKKIDDNLDQQMKINRELEQLSGSSSNENDVNEESRGLVFFQENESVINAPLSENVQLYKNSSSSLFTFSQTNEQDLSPHEMEQAIVKEKINGLLTGKITEYGNYVMVTAEITVYPGSNVIATVMDIGSIDDIQEMASNLVQALMPEIANAMPVHVYISLTPEEIASEVKLSVDGVVYSGVPEKIILDSGMHNFEFSLDGYASQSVSYNFVDSPYFLMKVPMSTINYGNYVLQLQTSLPGNIYMNGQLQTGYGFPSPVVPVTINSKSVLGQYTVNTFHYEDQEITDENGNTVIEKVKVDDPVRTSFFYVPDVLQAQDAQLTVRINPQDTSDLIEQRRIWAYRGYSALLISLPFTFISMGNANTASEAYSLGRVDSSNVVIWNTAAVVTGVISGISAGFFVFELVRYFKAANSIIPVKADVYNGNTDLMQASSVQEQQSDLSENADEGEASSMENNDVNTDDEGVTVQKTESSSGEITGDTQIEYK